MTIDISKSSETPEPVLVGVDESGYGAIAGPITICAVYIKPEWRAELLKQNIRDSKKMSRERRLRLASWITEHKAVNWAIVNQPAHMIESVSPWDAVCKGARTALIILNLQMGYQGDLGMFSIIMDGKSPIPGLPKKVTSKSLIGADDKILEVSIAALLAKVHRDYLMIDLSNTYPIYKWDSNKGYGDVTHLEALFKWGPTLYHRYHYGVKMAMKRWAIKHHQFDSWPIWLKELHPRYNPEIGKRNKHWEYELPEFPDQDD